MYPVSAEVTVTRNSIRNISPKKDMSGWTHSIAARTSVMPFMHLEKTSPPEIQNQHLYSSIKVLLSVFVEL